LTTPLTWASTSGCTGAGRSCASTPAVHAQVKGAVKVDVAVAVNDHVNVNVIVKVIWRGGTLFPPKSRLSFE